MKFLQNNPIWNDEVLLDVQSVLAELALKVTPPGLPFSKGEG